jgi:tetratricopeptide (TPR) repeat protein
MTMQPRDKLSEARLRHAAHYLEVIRGCDGLYLQGGENLTRALAMFDLEMNNIEKGQRWAVSRLQDDATARRLVSDYPVAGAYLLDLRQHPRERIASLEAALEATRRLKARGREAVHLGNLGLVYAAFGEMRRAIDFHTQALTIAREFGDGLCEAIALFNLSNALYQIRQREQAMGLMEAALPIFEQIESPYAAHARETLTKWRNFASE